MSIQKIRVNAEKHNKEFKKQLNKFRSSFSSEERRKAKNCKEGRATIFLRELALAYLNATYGKYNEKYLDFYIKNRPSTLNILFSTYESIKNIYDSNKSYYNKYFASEWYKLNWHNIIEEWKVKTDN
jgi:hypothetical protein